MKNIKSSKVFENLKPSDEQKKMIYSRIKNEIVKNDNDIILENHGVEIVKRKKINKKSAIYPSLAAAVLILVFASAIPGLKDNDFHAGKKHSADITGTDPSSETEVDCTLFDSSMSYTAEQIDEGSFNFIGSHNGKFYCSRIDQTFKTTYGMLLDPSFNNILLDQNEHELSAVTDIVANDKIYISGFDNEGNGSVCVYNSDLSELLFSLYSDINCSLIAQGDDKNSLYGVCEDSNNDYIGIQKRDLNDQIIREVDLEPWGFKDGYVSDLFIMKSGNVAALYAANDGVKNYLSVILFDSDLRFLTSFVSDELGNGKMKLAEYDDNLYIAQLNFINSQSSGAKVIFNNKINIYSVDFDDLKITQQSSEIPLSFEVENKPDFDEMVLSRIYKGSNGYDFFYRGPDQNLYGYKIKEGIAQKVQENIDPQIENLFYIGDKLYGTCTEFLNTSGIFSSVSEGDVVFCSEQNIDGFKKNNGIMPDGNIVQLFPADMDNNYIVYNINPDTNVAQTTQLKSERQIVKCLIKDEYIVARCVQIGDIYESIINIYNKEGTLLNTINPDNGVVYDIFLTAENKLIASVYDEKTDKWSAAEVDAETGTLKNIQVSWLKFLSSPYHITGSDGYSEFFICNDGVYSAEEKEDDYICEKIVDFNKVEFPDRVYGSLICGFAYDRNGNIYLLTIDDRVYMLKEKYN